MEQGLAVQSVEAPMQPQAPQQSDQGMSSTTSPQQMVEQVVMMLMEGVDPENLLQQGVPMEIIQAAIEIIMAQEQQQQVQQSAPSTEAGLAMTSAQGM
jgi:hypothetical protein